MRVSSAESCGKCGFFTVRYQSAACKPRVVQRNVDSGSVPPSRANDRAALAATRYCSIGMPETEFERCAYPASDRVALTCSRQRQSDSPFRVVVLVQAATHDAVLLSTP